MQLGEGEFQYAPLHKIPSRNLREKRSAHVSRECRCLHTSPEQLMVTKDGEGLRGNRNRGNSSERFCRNNRKGGTASLRSRTCLKRNAVFGARFKGFFFVFSISKRESDTYQNGLGYISDTYPNPYPPGRGTPLMIILILGSQRGSLCELQTHPNLHSPV